jgi:hypothetical protein
MPGNWPVPFGKGLSEKDPRHGHLVGSLLHLKRRGLETERHTPPRQSPTLLAQCGLLDRSEVDQARWKTGGTVASCVSTVPG